MSIRLNAVVWVSATSTLGYPLSGFSYRIPRGDTEGHLLAYQNPVWEISEGL